MSDISGFRGAVDWFTELVREFVQAELGCDCPEEVFEQIRILRGEATPGNSELGLIIGERLLVAFINIENMRPVGEKGRHAILTGVTFRDALKLNRFRLVVQGDISEEERMALEEEAGKCERVHVHCFEGKVKEKE